MNPRTCPHCNFKCYATICTLCKRPLPGGLS